MQKMKINIENVYILIDMTVIKLEQIECRVSTDDQFAVRRKKSSFFFRRRRSSSSSSKKKKVIAHSSFVMTSKNHRIWVT